MEKKLQRSSTNKKISGVCGGVAEYLGIDATWVRLIWAGVTLFSCGTAVVAYILAALIIPVEETTL